MSISSVSGTSSLLQVAQLQSAQSVSGLTETTAGESTGVSKMADLMGQLQSLQQSDPDTFTKVMDAISEQLQSAAEQTEGGEAGFLSDMADRFSEAADTGDLSSVQPPPPPPGGGEPPQRAAAAYGKTTSSSEPPVDLAQLIQSTLSTYASTSTATA